MAVAMVVLKRMFPSLRTGIGGDDRRALLAGARGDDLVEGIGGLSIEGRIPQFVTDEERWFGTGSQLADQRAIHPGSQ